MEMKFLLSMLIVFYPYLNKAFNYVDFDTSMRSSLHKNIVEKNSSTRHNFNFFKELYSCCRKKPTQSLLRIPKIIHQIWLGSPNQQLPKRFRAWQKSIQENHPDWQYKLWTEKDLIGFDFCAKDIFEREKNPGAKADILRCAILNEFGGVYLDVDMQSVQPLDELHYLYDFYIGIQPLDTQQVQLGIGIIGSIAGHPLLKAYLELVRHNVQQQIIVRTGPVFFTALFATYAGKTGYHDCALPASYFYPLSYTDTIGEINKWLCPESYTIHHWAGSWLTAEA